MTTIPTSEKPDRILDESVSKYELRRLFVAALADVPDTLEGLNDLLRKSLRDIVGIDIIRGRANYAPYGLVRIKRRVHARRWVPAEPINSADGRPLGRRMQQETGLGPSSTMHILNGGGFPVCTLREEWERVPEDDQRGGEFCAACKRIVEEKRPWPLFVYPWDESAPSARVVSLDEYRAKAKAKAER